MDASYKSAIPAAMVINLLFWITLIPLMINFACRRNWTSIYSPFVYVFLIAIFIFLMDVITYNGYFSNFYFATIWPWLSYAVIMAVSFRSLKKLQNAEAQKDQV